MGNIYKGMGLYLHGGPRSNWFRVLKVFEKKTLILSIFQRIINFNMDKRCMCEYKHAMNIKQY